MLSIETETQQSAPIDPAISNAGGVNQNPTDPGILFYNQIQVLDNCRTLVPVANWCEVFSFGFYAFCMHYNFNKLSL